MLTAVTALSSLAIKGVSGYFTRKQELKKAVHENKIKLARSKQSHNQNWEMKQLENAGWKDDILFYLILGLFGWSAFDPEGARIVFDNWQILPEWLLNITGWLVASVIGVKKIGDYLPSLLSGVKQAVKAK